MPSGNFFPFPPTSLETTTFTETFVIPAYHTEPGGEFYRETAQVFLTVKLRPLGWALSLRDGPERCPALSSQLQPSLTSHAPSCTAP